MIQANIVDFKAGWFVGDFEPSIFKNPFLKLRTILTQKVNKLFLITMQSPMNLTTS